MQGALIVVDYQKDFVTGSLGFPEAAALEENIIARIEAHLAAGNDILFTLDTHGSDYLQTQEGRELPIAHCIKGEEGWEIYGRVADYLPRAAAVFEKPVFGSTALGAFVAQRAFREIELCGVVSNICVLSNAVLCRAFSPETVISIHRDCVAAPDPVLHEQALAVLASTQIRITESSENGG